MRARSEIDQDRVALGSAGHPQTQEVPLCGGQRILAISMRNEHADLAGGGLLGLCDRCYHFAVVERSDECPGMHAILPTPAGSAATAAASAARESPPA